ncbi:hypothetical protein KW801_00875 [Candidatus Saccharibacteria bacterium]|nr:hypothetical protein [Candidatus Saccharibacteria bacterium]
MKQKDLLIVGITAFVAAIFSIVLSGVLFGSPKKNPIKVPVVDKISSTFPSPQNDDNYKVFFNDKALNPTQLIQIGGSNNTNTKPFQNTNQ